MAVVDQQRAGCLIGHDYPAPIVEHAAQRERALALFKAAAN
jgi:deoxyribodipyrimidine photo-lyase